jgi:hypothetical protein
MKPALVFETSVRGLGECGGHFWAPAISGPPHMKSLKN